MIVISSETGIIHETSDGDMSHCGEWVRTFHQLRHYEQSDVTCKFCRAAILGERVAAEAPEITMESIVGEALKQADALFINGDLDKDPVRHEEFYRWVGVFIASAFYYKQEVMTKR